MKIIPIASPQDWSARVRGPLSSGFDPQSIAQHGADTHWICADAGGEARAHCSLWWTRTPRYENRRVGAIGHFAALDADAAKALLDHACRELAVRGVKLAVGPMDGNTWRSYRLVTEPGDEPPFFLEPANPPEWPGFFEAAGFTALAHYSSGLNDDLSQEDPRIERAAARLQSRGVSVRILNRERFDSELVAIHELSLTAFAGNFLYTPVGRDEFLAQYRRLEPLIDPRLILLAEANGELAGFVFGIPDLAQRARGAPLDTMILKTVAALPGRAWAGLGNLLVARLQQAARELGYRRVIHALMHDSNNSRNLSGRYARTMRRYTLYARTLEKLSSSPLEAGLQEDSA